MRDDSEDPLGVSPLRADAKCQGAGQVVALRPSPELPRAALYLVSELKNGHCFCLDQEIKSSTVGRGGVSTTHGAIAETLQKRRRHAGR